MMVEVSPTAATLFAPKPRYVSALNPPFPFANRRFRRLSKPTRQIRLVPGGSSVLSQKSVYPVCSATTQIHILPKRLLQEPIVSCALGKLYNKDAILEYLLDKSSYGDGEVICGHIRSLKVSKCTRSTFNTASFTFKFLNG